MNGRPADTCVWEPRDSPGNTCIAVYVIEFSHVGGGMSIHMVLCRKGKKGLFFSFYMQICGCKNFRSEPCLPYIIAIDFVQSYLPMKD